MIRRGKEFLRSRPGTPYRDPVTFLVAEAYTTWWALSNETEDSAMSDYVDPKQYQQGAEEARLKSIRHFEQVLELAPNTEFAKYARRVLPHLQQKRVPNTYRFSCIYD